MQLNTFSRVANNESKMGAYYTDLAHCESIAQMLHFPERDEVSALEPSIGDGKAIITVTGATTNSNIKIFGVELNDETFEQTRKNPLICELLRADFTEDVVIRRGCFSFCFGNPPYLEDTTEQGNKGRMERVFLDKVTNYLSVGAVLVWVIPYARFAEGAYLRAWMNNYDTLAFYRFREPEYSKFHQIVVIGRKVSKRTVLNMQVEQFTKEWNLSNPPLLPETFEQPFIEVFPSKESGVDLFTTKTFNNEEAYELLKGGVPEKVSAFFNTNVTQQAFTGGSLLRPPIPLKKDSQYLLVTSGFSDGLVGSEETLDKHLMRGVANVVEFENYNTGAEEDDDGEQEEGTITVTSSTEIELRVLENDGTITLLK